MEKSFYECGLWSQLVWMTMNITTYQLGQTWSSYFWPLYLSFLTHIMGIMILSNVIDL